MNVLVVTGLPATGKTTLARALARRFGAAFLGKDIIKEPLLEVLGARDRAESRALSDASFASLFAIARELAGAGVDLILEGNFRPGAHEHAMRSILSAGAGMASRPLVRTAQVLCRCDESERIARLRSRAADPARNRAHGDLSPDVLADRSADAFLDLPGARFELGRMADPAPVEHWWLAEA